MKNMKKIAALLLALVMLLALCACGGSNADTSTADDSAADTAAADENADSVAGPDADTADADAADADTDAASGDEGTLTTISAGKLTMATSPDFPPYEFLDDSGNTTGIEPEILALIASKLGLELQIDEMDFDSALMAVQTGKSDLVVSGVTVTDDRKLVMNFTDSYTTAVQVIVVPEGSSVTLDNLGEQSIGTQRGTTGYLFTVDDYGEDHVIGYDTYTSVFQALLNGQVDCAVLDDAVARAYVEQNPGLTILETEYVVEEYAFGVDKNNEALLEAVNNALKELVDDGTVQGIIDKYISG